MVLSTAWIDTGVAAGFDIGPNIGLHTAHDHNSTWLATRLHHLKPHFILPVQHIADTSESFVLPSSTLPKG